MRQILIVSIFLILFSILAASYYSFQQKNSAIAIESNLIKKIDHTEVHLHQSTKSPQTTDLSENKSIDNQKNTIMEDFPSKSNTNKVDKNIISPEKDIDILWKEYFSVLPKLYRGYSSTIAEKLDGEGFDKKSRYNVIQKETAIMSENLHREIIRGIKDEEINEWKSRFNSVRDNYIKLIVAGDSYAAWWLGSEYIHPPMKDDAERLSWIMIAIAMGFQTNPTQVCDPSQFSCSEEILKKALDQAYFYIDYYEIKNDGGNE